jgi:hypothetical protein
MDTKELRGLYEAYSQVYESDYINEEVEIATEYFINEGYDENDIKNLIEELGVDEFADFVYEIVESYDLVEARRGGVRIEPVTKTGKSVGSLKGGAKTTSINRLRKEKEARRKSESEASAQKPSGLKSFMRDTTTSKPAKKEEPKSNSSSTQQKRQGIGGLIGSALRSATQKAKSDIELTRKSLDTAKSAWKSASDTKAAQRARIGIKKGARAVEKHGHSVGSAAGKAFGTAVGATLRAGKRAGQSESGKKIKQGASKVMFKDEFEDYDVILSYLIDEGFADNLESAEKIMINMSEEWLENIMEREMDEPGERDSNPDVQSHNKSLRGKETLEQRIKRKAAEQRARGSHRRPRPGTYG